MAYYEFFNLPSAENWGDAAKNPTETDARGADQGEWAETGDRSVRISFSLFSSTNEKGWMDTGPQYATVSIARSVRLPSHDATEASPNIVAGDLLLYRVALLSTDSAWSCDLVDSARWPGVYLEFDTRTGLRLRATLKRLAIEDWQMEAITDDHGRIKSIRETLTFRAWVVSLENSTGNALEVSLGDSAIAEAAA